MIHIKPSEIEEACEGKSECGLLISVYGLNTQKDKQNDYTIKIYSNLARLIGKSPHIGRIKAGSYQYFDFYVGCEKCTVLITAETFNTNQDIDVYINQGTIKNFPTKEKNDIFSEKWSSENVEIS